MNETPSTNAYLKTKVMTASPEELRLLLLDGALRFARQARTGLEKADHEMIYSGFSQCRDIVLELLNTIRSEPAPEVAESVRQLYTYMYGELVKASFNKDTDLLDQVIKLLDYERETWVLAMDQLHKDREAGIAPVAMPGGAPNTMNQPHQPLSVQA